MKPGINAMLPAKAWWHGRVPFAEVADWIGAGVRPKEPAEERDRGITVGRVAFSAA